MASSQVPPLDLQSLPSLGSFGIERFKSPKRNFNRAHGLGMTSDGIRIVAKGGAPRRSAPIPGGGGGATGMLARTDTDTVFATTARSTASEGMPLTPQRPAQGSQSARPAFGAGGCSLRVDNRRLVRARTPGGRFEPDTNQFTMDPNACFSPQAKARDTFAVTGMVGDDGQAAFADGHFVRDKRVADMDDFRAMTGGTLVLRWDAYFREAVPESSLESSRVRRVRFFYYAADDSLQILEPKVANSGMPHGTFMHRQPLANFPGFAVRDLVVGGDVVFQGVTFRVTDCDARTRGFFRDSYGVEQGAPLAAPVDSFARATAPGRNSSLMRAPSPPDGALGSCLTLGTGRARSPPPPTAAQKCAQFLANDRKVLRFWCRWNAEIAVFGGTAKDVRSFVLHYFLADNTGELRVDKAGQAAVSKLGAAEARRDRSGQSILLKRQPLLKPHAAVHLQTGQQAKLHLPPEDLFQPGDFRVGGTVHLFGKDIVLLDADDFTRGWYRDVLGAPQPPPMDPDSREREAAAERRERERQEAEQRNMVKTRANIYGRNAAAFGSEADAAAARRSLSNPRPPRKDQKKLLENDGKKLTFSAELASTLPQDAGRRFIVGYQLADDTLSVYEPPQPSSGFSGGKFLQRAKYINPVTGKNFAAADLKIGIIICAQGHRFRITGANGFTMRYMEDNPKLFPESSLEVLHSKFLVKLMESKIPIRKLFADADADGSKFMDAQEFQAFVERVTGEAVTAQELKMLLFKFGDGDNKIWYDEFIDAVQRGSYKAQKILSDLDRVNKAEDVLIEKLRQEKPNIQHTFRSFDLDKNGVLTLDEFRFMIERYHIRLTEAEIAELMARFDHDREGVISYNEFCEHVHPDDFSSALDAEDNSYASMMKEIHRRAAAAVPIDAYLQRIKAGNSMAADEVASDKILKEFARQFFNRNVSTRKTFRMFNSDTDGTIDKEEFVEACGRLYPLTPTMEKCLLESFFKGGAEHISYRDFMLAMWRSDNVCMPSILREPGCVETMLTGGKHAERKRRQSVTSSLWGADF